MPLRCLDVVFSRPCDDSFNNLELQLTLDMIK